MAINVTVLGSANTAVGGASSISLTVGSTVQAGNQIYLVVCSDAGYDNVIDAAGNNYNLVAGSQSGVDAALWNVFNNLRIANGTHITISRNDGVAFNARMAAFEVSGLTAGNLIGSSAGQGFDTHPLAALDSVPANDYVIGVACVAGPSSDGFTQDANFTNPGNLNVQTTTAVSAYAGYHQMSATGKATYAPTLGVARTWSCMLIALTA